MLGSRLHVTDGKTTVLSPTELVSKSHNSAAYPDFAKQTLNQGRPLTSLLLDVIASNRSPTWLTSEEPMQPSYVGKESDEMLFERVCGLEAPNGVVELNRRDSLNRKIPAAKYVRLLIRTNKDAGKLSKDRLRKRVQIVETVLDELGEDVNDTILKELNRRKGFDTRREEKTMLSLEGSYTMMRLAGCNLSQFTRIDRFLRTMKDYRLFPKNYAIGMSEFEKLCKYRQRLCWSTCCLCCP